MQKFPLSQTALDIIAEEEISRVKLLNRVRYITFCLIVIPIIISSVNTSQHAGIYANTITMVLYLGVTILHTFVINRSDIGLIRKFNYISLIADVGIIMFLLISWTIILEPKTLAFTAKSPLWFFYALIIATTSFQFDRKLVYLAIILFLLFYGVILGIMFTQGVETTGNWIEYVEGSKIDWGDLVFTKPVVIIMIGLSISYILRKSQELILKISAAETNRFKLSRYFSPSVVEQITSGEADFSHGSRQKATILFLDIRNFTSISERLDNKDLVDWLSDFRSRFTSTIFKHKGSVDKYIGDAILATFGTPHPSPDPRDDTKNAMLCAIDMLKICKDLDRDWVHKSIQNEIGIGIHTGEVFTGNIGDADQIEYTVIGDPVNTASRIENLCKKLKRKLIFSDSVYNDLVGQFEFEALPRVQVKGKTKALILYTLKNLD